MSKKCDHYGLVYHICYDPIKELYYAGIPGYRIPTIYIGRTEAEVQDSVEDLLVDYIECCADSGYCHEIDIGYSAQEAYCTGWIVKEKGAKVPEQGFQTQKERQIAHQKLNDLIKAANRDADTYRQIIYMHGHLEALQEDLADLHSEMQYIRNELIDEANKTGQPLVSVYGMELMKVNRLGVLQKE